MPNRPVTPTDPDNEAAQGRVAVWLDPGDIRWLTRHLAGIDGQDHETNDIIGRLRFRTMTALHKAGLPNNSWVDEDHDNTEG